MCPKGGVPFRPPHGAHRESGILVGDLLEMRAGTPSFQKLVSLKPPCLAGLT